MTELAKAIILMGCAIGSGIAMISGFGPGIGDKFSEYILLPFRHRTYV